MLLLYPGHSHLQFLCMAIQKHIYTDIVTISPRHHDPILGLGLLTTHLIGFWNKDLSLLLHIDRHIG
jgi:hypothetical protein